MTTFPPNPPENPYPWRDYPSSEFHDFANAQHEAWRAGFSAADSWWRSRLVSDETVEAAQVALRKAVGGYSEFGDRERAAAEDRRILRAVLAALLPVAEKPPACRAPHCFSEYGTPCGTCPAEKPETDT